MFETVLSSAISVDPMTESIAFYQMEEGERRCIQCNLVNYKARPFDGEFFSRFEKTVKLFQENHPQHLWQKCAVVLPDHLFLTDIVQIPTIRRLAMRNSLDLAVGALYKNSGELKLNTYPVQQNKQRSTYGLVGIRKELLTMLQKSLANCGIGIGGVTFAANAAVNAAMVLNPKLKNGTFLLLDIKEAGARFSFVVKGRTMGYYDLPFGFRMLYDNRMASEEGLFDHSAGQLLVRNARERAKAKQLTIGQEELYAPVDDEDGQEEGESVLASKSIRKKPKFMQRPEPQDREGWVFENFRIFMKWTLELLAGNPGITAFGSMETVYVNLPDQYRVVLELANQEKEENGVTFIPLLPEGTDTKIAGNLELFGGFYIRQYNKSNTF